MVRSVSRSAWTELQTPSTGLMERLGLSPQVKCVVMMDERFHSPFMRIFMREIHVGSEKRKCDGAVLTCSHS